MTLCITVLALLFLTLSVLCKVQQTNVSKLLIFSNLKNGGKCLPSNALQVPEVPFNLVVFHTTMHLCDSFVWITQVTGSKRLTRKERTKKRKLCSFLDVTLTVWEPSLQFSVQSNEHRLWNRGSHFILPKSLMRNVLSWSARSWTQCSW